MNIDRYLKKTGLTETQLANRANVPRTIINEVKRGYGTSAHNAYKIIKASKGEITLRSIASKVTKRPVRVK